MTAVKRVSLAEMLRETGVPALGYAQPKKDRILLVDGLPKAKEKEVLGHEAEHIAKGEEGPFLESLIAGGGALLGGLLGADAAKDAAKASAKASQAAIDEQRRQFDVSMGLLQPSINTGNAARSQLASILGLSVPDTQYNSGVSELSRPGGVKNPNALGPLVGGRLGGVSGALLGFALGGRTKSSDRPIAQKDLDRLLETVKQNPTDYDEAREIQALIDRNRPGARRQIYDALDKADLGYFGVQAGTVQPGGGNAQNASPVMSNDEIMARLEQYPGFQFAVEQARKAAAASASAAGESRISGNVLTGLQKDIAGNVAMPVFSDYLNRVANLAGTGQTASTNAAGLGQTNSANIGTLLQNQGDTRASGIIGRTNSVLGGVQGALSALGPVLARAQPTRVGNSMYTPMYDGISNASFR